MEEQEALVELLEDVLGDHGLHYPNRGQISFNCPVCDDGRDKHNLEIIDIFNEDATLNSFGLHYQGKDRFVVREEIAKELNDTKVENSDEEYTESNEGKTDDTKEAPVEKKSRGRAKK